MQKAKLSNKALNAGSYKLVIENESVDFQGEAVGASSPSTRLT